MPARLQVSQVIIARGLHRQVAVFDDACQKMRCSVRRTYTYIRAFPTVMNVCVSLCLSVSLFVFNTYVTTKSTTTATADVTKTYTLDAERPLTYSTDDKR